MKNSTFSLFVWIFFNFLFFLNLQEVEGTRGACKMVSNLDRCSWINYNSWFPNSINPKNLDSQIQTNSLSKGEHCSTYYASYLCAQNFPKCNENQDGPLPVCRDTCQALIDACGPIQGINQEFCNALPESECTSHASFVFPVFNLLFLFVPLVFII